MASAQQNCRAVSDELCDHCRARLGANRGQCWWCRQAFEDERRSQIADFQCEGENAQAFAPQRMAFLLGQYGIFFGQVAEQT